MALAGVSAKAFFSPCLHGEVLSGVSRSVCRGPVTPGRLCLDALIPAQKGLFFPLAEIHLQTAFTTSVLLDQCQNLPEQSTTF